MSATHKGETTQRRVLKLVLPFPPSLNHYYRHVGPRTLISREGRSYRKRVCALLKAQRVEPLKGGLTIEIELHPPDRRRRDVDNSMKGLLDSLEHGGAYHDDGQIVRLEAEKHEPVPGGQVVVTIEEIA